jgi:hypothetical protein
MTQPIQLLEKCLQNSITITIALILVILMPTGLLAAEKNPKDPPPKTTGTSGGSRAYEKMIFIDSEMQQMIDNLLIANREIAQS